MYIPSFNKNLGFRNIVKKNFEILGSAHNVAEVKIKEKQGCSAIFLSPIFENDNGEPAAPIEIFARFQAGFLSSEDVHRIQ